MVRLDEDGKPHSVRVLQTIVLKRLGDYVLTIPAPVLSVSPGPRTESQPGRRENQILWEGFSPGRRVLAAWADLRVAESVAGLPVEVNVEPGEVTIRNATAVTVPSFTADPVPASIAEVSSRVRASIKANLFPEGLNVALHGKQTPEQLRVAAPLRVRGTVRVSGERVPFSGLLDGIRRPELRVPIPDGDPKLEMRVQTADIDLPRRLRARALCSRRRSGSSSPTRGSASSTSSSRARTRPGPAPRSTSTERVHLFAPRHSSRSARRRTTRSAGSCSALGSRPQSRPPLCSGPAPSVGRRRAGPGSRGA